MATCKECKWWNTEGTVPGTGVCELTVRQANKYAAFDTNAWAGSNGPVHTDDDVFLVTTPDFSCNQFEAKT